jgi:4-hydroxybenzoate polyprenyltransferase
MVRKLADLILYSSFWIGACAVSLVLFTYDATGHYGGLDLYAGFVFCGTVVIYSVHRLVGIGKMQRFADQGRFAVISRYRSHIVLYGILGVIAGAWFFFHLPLTTIGWLAIPVLLSFLYVVPLKAKRLRDYAFVKIFLIAGVWAALTGLIPLLHTADPSWVAATLLFLERTFFVFAITIPFDIRDMAVDQTSGLQTLPHWLGVGKAKRLAILFLCLSSLLTVVLVNLGTYRMDVLFPIACVFLLTTALILHASREKDDYYYSGLLDGTMFLTGFLYWIFSM